MLRAAKVSTKSLDGKTVKSALQKLVDDGALGKDSLKLLAKTADTAAKTLRALDKFTGAQLGAAVKPAANGQPASLDASTKVGKAAQAAIDAQRALSEMLAQLDRSLDSLACHADEMREAERQAAGSRAAAPGFQLKFKSVDVALQNEVVAFRQLADRRATEIDALAFQMHDFGVHLAAKGENADPNVRAILAATAKELLPRQALAMHGTDALATASAEIAGKLGPLLDRIDAFRADPAADISGETFLALQSELRTVKEAVADAARSGIATGEAGGARTMLPEDIAKEFSRELHKADELLATARKDVASRIREDVHNAILAEFAATSDDAMMLRSFDPVWHDFFQKRAEMLRKLQAYVEACDRRGTVSEEQIAAARNAFQKAANKLATAAVGITEMPPQDSNPARIAYRLRRAALNVRLLVRQFADADKCLADGGDRFLTGREALSVFDGRLSVSSVVEARAHGLSDADVDPANEDANIASERPLGAGAAGSVQELTRKDGTKVVFKGEIESRSGLAGIVAGMGSVYGDAQKVVSLNLAANHAAGALGCGDLVVQYKAGCHKGVFGFYMDKAPGYSGMGMATRETSSDPDAGLSAKEISRLPPGPRLQVKADLMRELSRLQWLDLVTGQVDRHYGNYFVHVDRTTRKVTVKGIDNDAGFYSMRVGLQRFALDANRTAVFRRNLELLAEKIDRNHKANVLARLLADPGIAVDAETGNIAIDAAKIAEKAILACIHHTVGAQSLALPDRIDRSTYDALLVLKNDQQRRAAYLDGLRRHLGAANVRAAESRLDDAIAHAERLAAAGKVLDAADWLAAHDEPLGHGQIRTPRANGRQVALDHAWSDKTHFLVCPSYFTRDYFDRLFG